jgi:hypothetical protein
LYSLRSVSFGSGEGLVAGDMCSGELAAEAATAAAAAARLRWRREAGWDPRFLHPPLYYKNPDWAMLQ